MAKKYYVVWKGRETGIFNTWDKCKSLVDGYSGARYKSYGTLESAQAAFQNKKPAAKKQKKVNVNIIGLLLVIATIQMISTMLKKSAVFAVILEFKINGSPFDLR